MAHNAVSINATSSPEDLFENIQFFRKDGWHNLVSIHPETEAVDGIVSDKRDELVAFIEQYHGTHNLYFTPNRPVPSARRGKIKKDEIAAIEWLYADLDPDKTKPFEEERERLAKAADAMMGLEFPPTAIVDSGGGYQAFWKQEPIGATPEAVREYERTGRGAAEVLGGDHVQNVERLMRVPGSINLPDAKKRAAGRRVTEGRFIIRDDRPPTPLAQLQTQFPPVDVAAHKEIQDFKIDYSRLGEVDPDLVAKFKELKTDTLAKLIKGEHESAGDRSDMDFAFARELMWVGFNEQETCELLYHFKHGKVATLGLDELPRYLNRILAKNYLPDAAEEFTPQEIEDKRPKPQGALFHANRIPDGYDVETKQPRRWVLGNRTIQGAVSVGSGAPGSNKSTLAIASALAVITGRSDITGEQVYQQGRVFLFSAEDSEEEIEKRIAGACRHHGIDINLIRPHLFYVSGISHPMWLAAMKDRQAEENVPLVDALIAFFKENQIVFASFDPLISMHGGLSENDNQHMNLLMNAASRIAHEADVAVDLVHHTNKAGSTEKSAGDITASRGAQSIVGRSRVAYTITYATGIVTVTTARGSYSPRGDGTLRFRVISHSLNNARDQYVADTVPVLIPATSTIEQDTRSLEEQSHEMVRQAVVECMVSDEEKANPIKDKLGAHPQLPGRKVDRVALIDAAFGDIELDISKHPTVPRFATHWFTVTSGVDTWEIRREKHGAGATAPHVFARRKIDFLA